MPFNSFRKFGTVITALLLTVIFCAHAPADTFTHNLTGEVLHGYATSRVHKGETFVFTKQKGLVKLNLNKWHVTADRLGRNNKVAVIPINGPLMYEIQTAALEEHIAGALSIGPLFILLQIDTPGGRTDFAQRICGALNRTNHCPVIAYVTGGEYGGAVSAGAALALACDKTYMANNTIIGAAATITFSDTGRPQALSETLDEDVAEKYSSAWRAFLASLAQQNDRPALLARAMADNDIEVIEVTQGDKRLFIDPVNKKPDQQIVRIWSTKGSLLTLTAEEAVKCNIADKVVDSQQQLLELLDAADAEVAVDNCFNSASRELKRAKGTFERIRKSIDLKVKEADTGVSAQRVLANLRSLRSEFKTLIKLATRYPDLGLDIRALEDELNSIEANYQKIRIIFHLSSRR